MDVCHAPDCLYLKTPDGVAIESEAILSLFHNGPSWTRIAGLEADYADWKRKDEKREDPVKQLEITAKIVELAKEGKNVSEIMAATGATRVQVKNAINRAKAKGELPQAELKKLINRAPHNASKQDPQEAPAPKFSSSSGTAIHDEPTPPKSATEIINPAMRSLLEAGIQVQPFVPSPDLSKPFPAPPAQEAPSSSILAPAPANFAKLHEMIDLCARLPELTAGLLKSCDEIETAARYQLALVAEIRGKLSA